MKELSLHILDIAQNSITAGASLVNIIVVESASRDAITIDIIDDGCGMSKELLERVISPFTTSRTTRKVGLHILRNAVVRRFRRSAKVVDCNLIL